MTIGTNGASLNFRTASYRLSRCFIKTSPFKTALYAGKAEQHPLSMMLISGVRFMIRYLFCTVLMGCVLQTTSHAQWTYTRIADTTTAIPAGTGNFTSFYGAATSNGLVVFRGSGNSSQQGLYTWTAGTGLQLVVNKSSTTPSGGLYTSFERPDLDASGNIAFMASTSSPTTSQGIYARLGGSMTTIATTTTATPSFTNGNFFRFDGLGSASIDQGQVVFSAFSSNNLSQFTQGVYRYQSGSLSRVADRSTSFPYGAGSSSMIFIDRAMIHNGDVIFNASTGSGGTSGVYSVRSNVLRREIDNTQFLPGSSSLFALEGTVDRGPAIAGNRTNFFSVNSFSPQTGHYGTDSDNVVKSMLTYGNIVPGTSSNFVGLGYLSLNPDGSFAVYGGSVQVTALWYSPTFTGAGLQKIIAYQDSLDGRVVQNPDSTIYALDGNNFVFTTTFSDGSSGVYLAMRAVPEPGTVALAASGVALALWYVRHVHRQRRKLAEAEVDVE
jgi:hypothetical protein